MMECGNGYMPGGLCEVDPCNDPRLWFLTVTQCLRGDRGGVDHSDS